MKKLFYFLMVGLSLIAFQVVGVEAQQGCRGGDFRGPPGGDVRVPQGTARVGPPSIEKCMKATRSKHKVLQLLTSVLRKVTHYS